MKNWFYSNSQLTGLLLVSLVLFIFYSCSKDNDILSGISSDADNKTTPVDYDLDRINGIDKAKVQFSKILANAIAKHPPIKEMLFEMVFDEQSKKSREVFVLDLIAPSGVSSRTESFKDLLLTYGDVTPEEFDDLVNTFCQDYPNVVIDVPAYVEWAYSHEETSEKFSQVYQNYPFAILPNTHEPNLIGKWTGYGDLAMDGNSSLYEIGNSETYEDVIPFIVKAAERTLMFNDGLILINGRNVIESYVGDGLTEEVLICFTEQLGELKATKILCGNQYELISFEDLMKIKEECDFFFTSPPPPSEICDDGIDNDDDGLIDCDDPDCDCEEEICDDGIDNDGDGLIDAADPDCNPDNLEICCDGIDNDGDGDIDEEDSDCCYRDCRTDHNYLLAHKFKDIVVGLSTTNSQVPGGERITQLKYQITTMEKSSPTSDPIAVHHNQIVVARTYILYCETPSMSALDDLTPEEISTLCLDDNDLYYNQTVKGFLGGLVFSGTPESNGYGNGSAQGFITFNLRDDIYVRVMHPKFVIQPLLYLRDKKDWDASLVADELRMSVFEIDEVESSTTTSESVQITRTHSISAKFGTKFSVGISVDIIDIGTETNFETSYNFTHSTQNTTSTSFTIEAKDVLELGDLSLFYCDEEAHNGQSYNISEQALGTDRNMHRIYERNTMLDWWDIIEDED